MIKLKAKTIKEFIKLNKYTKNQFCELVGITRIELDIILKGNLDFKFSSIIKLANFLNVPISWLFNTPNNQVQTSFYLD